MVICLLSMSVSTSFAAGQFRVGDQGEEIAEIQGQLVLLGYDVMADGAFGAATADAIKEFQKAQGIKADGLIGPATYSALLGKEMPDITHSASYLANNIISLSMNYIGVPYVFGGTSPYGFDCSGYVQYVFANAGISIPRTADVQYDFGTPISTTDLVSGDLVFFSTYTYGASHVGIYLGDNNFIHASSSRGVTIDSLGSSYWSSHYIGARRIL
ncbi:MAG: C40 family peptidase [Selenomonadaceae bacterium]|nr:C40 family peptidase [Selenomonadaceae bacterium]MBQ3727278.1 C40 family peptidase [Selenomonadaceae bacterium]MBQ9496084.1 C40 family peptidase [Selenomonadaceae bacterium]MBR3497615.1 C40 family peptidase [Selenomonadaceae bacterium]